MEHLTSFELMLVRASMQIIGSDGKIYPNATF